MKTRAYAAGRAEAFRRPMPVTDTQCYKNGDIYSICPRCRRTIDREFQSYCDRCGQCLDWRRF